MAEEKKKGAVKAGRSKSKMATRQAAKTTQKHKVVRVAKSSGRKAAEAYASQHGLTAWAIARLQKLELAN